MSLLRKDYIVDQFVRFAEAIRMGLEREAEGPGGDTGNAIRLLEAQVGESVNIDGEALLALAPESVVSILQVSGVDPSMAPYIVRALLLESQLLRSNGDDGLAGLRAQQGGAVAEAYGVAVPADVLDPEALEAFFAESRRALEED